MRVSRDVVSYCVDHDVEVIEVMRQLTEKKTTILFVCQSGVLLGSVTDGDIRRKIITEGHRALALPVSSLMKSNCLALKNQEEFKEQLFKDGIKVVPLVDEGGYIVKLYIDEHPAFNIGQRKISSQSPPFIIAEIGMNHQGSFDLACKLVDAAKVSGADCAKFQMRDMASLYSNSGEDDPSGDLGTQYTLSLLDRFSLTDNQMYAVFDYCKEVGILPLCTPWDISSLEKLEQYGMPAYKVASADFTNLPFIRQLGETRKPLILSTGMSTQAEVATTIDYLSSYVDSYCLLHCNSTYPTPFKDVHLNYIDTLRELAGEGSIIGYSGHERGWFVPCAAVAKGACVIEKHFTLDKNLEGNDHKVSLLPSEFLEMVNAIENTYVSLGSAGHRFLSQGEMINRQTLAKSVVARAHVCMYVCMYACMNACMYVFVYVCVCVCVYACTNVHTYVRTCVRTFVRAYVCMYAFMHVCMYVRTCIRTCVRTYVCM